MPSDPIDPLVAEADRRVEQAKASLRSRVELLERRFVEVRHRLDVPDRIRRHPWPAVGIAIAVGAVLGRGRRMPMLAAATEPSRGRALGIVGKVAIRILRELVLAQLALGARRWIDRNAGSFDGSDGPEFDDGYPRSVHRYPAP